MRIVIPINPITKKNSQQLVRAGGRYIPIPSKQYKAYEQACARFMPKLEEPIHDLVNIKAVFYMSTHRRVDLVNLQEAALDVLVKYKVIADDNCNIVASMDGSRVDYDRENPRTEIEIEKVREE